MRVIRFLCFFFKQKTAYDVRISDWSSDVCSSDLDSSSRSLRRMCLPCTYTTPRLRAIRRAARVETRLYTVRSTPSRSDRNVVEWKMPAVGQIGRASCRERVWQYV